MPRAAAAAQSEASCFCCATKAALAAALFCLPPRIAGGIRLSTPALFKLFFVLGVVKSVEHFFCHECFSNGEFVDGGGHRCDQPIDSLFFGFRQTHVVFEGAGVITLLGQRLGNRRESEPEFVQQQDPLKAG